MRQLVVCLGQCTVDVRLNYSVYSSILQEAVITNARCTL